MTGKLEGKVALVTGAARGIGLAAAQRLARDGATLVLNDLDRDATEDTSAALKASGVRVFTSSGDITERSTPEQLVRHAIDSAGRLDIIVNNAGYTWDSVIQKTTDQQWSAMMDVHLRAPFRLLRAAGAYFRSCPSSDGFRKVVNVSSVAAIYGNAGQCNYAAAKHGVIGLTRALAQEWGRFQVNVNCVAFGLIATRLTQTLGQETSEIRIADKRIAVGIDQDTLEAFERAIPLGRAGTPEEAASAIFLLCSPESDYITGQVLEVTGGLAI